MAGTKYQPLIDFYDARDRHIDAAILSTIKAHPGARIVVLTGADHRSTLIRFLQANAGAGVKLMAVP